LSSLKYFLSLLSARLGSPRDLNRFYPRALLQACLGQHLDRVEFLVKDMGVDPDIYFQTTVSCSPLIAVMRYYYGEHSERAVRILVNLGTKVQGKPGFKPRGPISTPLLAACANATVATVRFLIDAGASVHEAGIFGNLPIHFAAISGLGHFELVSQLYEGDLLATDMAGRTVLHWAANYCQVETIKHVLDKVVPLDKEKRRRLVNQADIDGWTPLAWVSQATWLAGMGRATEDERFENVDNTVLYLLEQGADPSVQFSVGQGDEAEMITPLAMAKRCSLRTDAAKILRDALRNTEGDQGHAERIEPKYLCEWAMCEICLSVRGATILEMVTANNNRRKGYLWQRVRVYHM
jgi:hypothetical protein